MKPEIKQVWLAALRSGQYQQGREDLHPTPETYCCLGVLCDLHRQQTGQGQWDIDGCYVTYRPLSSDQQFLPTVVSLWAGLSEDNPRIRAEHCSLADLNDEGKSFAEIADLIERYL